MALTNPINGSSPLLEVQQGLASVSVTVNDNNDNLSTLSAELGVVISNAQSLAIIVGGKATNQI